MVKQPCLVPRSFKTTRSSGDHDAFGDKKHENGVVFRYLQREQLACTSTSFGPYTVYPQQYNQPHNLRRNVPPS